MTNSTLEEILSSLPKINASRNYWFVRTNGGQYYNAFKKGKYIAIGYDKITLADIKAGNTGDDTGIQILAEKVNKAYGEDEYRPSYVSSQLLKFTYLIKKGDIVLIPSHSSQEISFGEVTQTPTFLGQPSNDDECPFLKRKSVKWLKTLTREELDPNLYRLMYSHHTISEADNYAEFIDKITNSFFIKNQKAHLILDVQTLNNIKAKDLFEMGSLSLQLLDDFCEAENLSYKSEDFDVKLDVQSPGFIELSGMSMGGIVLVGIILVSIAGGGFAFSYKKEVNASIKTEGIIEKVRKFLTSRSNIKTKKDLLEKHMKDLQIKDPEDLIKVLRELDK